MRKTSQFQTSLTSCLSSPANTSSPSSTSSSMSATTACQVTFIGPTFILNSPTPISRIGEPPAPRSLTDPFRTGLSFVLSWSYTRLDTTVLEEPVSAVKVTGVSPIHPWI
ncbi:hypothetical protein DPMN_172196 [Dreissena polymorpha]|uniref:Uncharacterized protein n=1 Tax=Dreissena polymorpha TaxID=45954 RepID=A0A9D4IGB1_DREPO|nr:hypothetical protein DPMN_172196 [Dreissena polymorpha]